MDRRRERDLHPYSLLGGCFVINKALCMPQGLYSFIIFVVTPAQAEVCSLWFIPRPPVLRAEEAVFNPVTPTGLIQDHLFIRNLPQMKPPPPQVPSHIRRILIVE